MVHLEDPAFGPPAARWSARRSIRLVRAPAVHPGDGVRRLNWIGDRGGHHVRLALDQRSAHADGRAERT